ncbi:HelD family protein [Acetobacterium carbinolicum]|uniref:HelD family protein n=1 Tax=Acetobacterium carbinolicum TaxID=52690 RepID=UPI0039C97410
MTNEKQNVKHKARSSDFIDPIPFPDEIAHLKLITDKLDAALHQANANVDRVDKEYMDAKRYMADYRGEIDPHEMFQNELALKQIDRTGAFSVGIWEKLAKLKESPYFARIDFQTNESQIATKHYIGRFAFSHENELLIIDWRAPFASMFYDCEVGLAGYDAPMGKIEGKLTRKRQFKVKNGVLEYALESSVNIHNDVLQRELSHTSDEKMKSIIATIQKEQNKIIRNEKAGTIIIQGVAGSGKTAIALHRIAFLLYRFKDKLAARNVKILSPNKVFSDYISTVLPELGEEPIREQRFAEIAKDHLEGIIAFEADKDPLETEDAKWAARVRFKSTLDFVKQMDGYLHELPAMIFEFVDYPCGRFVASADWIQRRFYGYQNYPIKKRLRLIAEDIHDRFDADNFRGEEIPRPGAILKGLMAMLKIKNSLALYRGFYQWLGLSEMLVLPARKTLEWADVYPFMYLHAAFEGLSESKVIKHLVIDEMQDYTPIQYAVINRLFPCQKTILGDYGQLINPNHRHTIADIQQLFSDARLVELTKSYRSTYEIIAFAKGIQPVDRLEPVERHGDAPAMIPCSDKEDEIAKVKVTLDAFLQSGNASLGIILKTNSSALVFYKLLAEDYQIQLISPDSTSFTNGISVTSIQMSKGLEFDEVIIPNANSDTYQCGDDRSLLYIAATRAMHRLTLLYWGEPSRFLPRP